MCEVCAIPVRCALSPIPAFPREAEEGDAAACELRADIKQRLPPHLWGRIEVGDKRPRPKKGQSRLSQHFTHARFKNLNANL